MLRIFSILKTKTLAHSYITVSGTVINGILGMVFYIVIARDLGPAVFGIFSVAIAVLTMIADIGDLGTDTGLIRFISKYLPSDRQKALQFMKLGLKVKIFAWILTLLLGWFFVPFAADKIFLKQELIAPLRLSLLGVGGALLFSFITHSIQAFQKYWSWSLLNVGLNALRLLIIGAAILSFGLDLHFTMLAYILIPFLGFLIGLLLLPNFITAKNENSVAKEFFYYNKWVALFILVAAVSSRLDTFILARLATPIQLGLYSAANQLTIIVPQLIFALATVVAPKLASYHDNKEAAEYLKKLQLLVTSLAVIGVFFIPVANWAIPLLFGSSYQQSIYVFDVLFLSQLVFLISLPVHQSIFYYFAKPNFFVWVSLGHLLIIGLLGWYLVISLGIMGAALAVLIGSIFNFIAPAIWVIYQLRKN